MVKEDRSGWVAVAPDHAGKEDDLPKVTPYQSAYQIFQRKNSKLIKQSLIDRGEPHDLAHLTKAISKTWKGMSADERDEYESEANKDRFRFMSESHKRDVAVTKRKEQLRRERDEIFVSQGDGRSTRRSRKKEMKKAAKAEKKSKKKKKVREIEDSDEDEFKSDDESSSSNSEFGSEDDGSSSSDSDSSIKKPKPKRKAPIISAAVLAKREKAKNEKQAKEKYIVSRQEDLRTERSAQAKKRLEFLLKQSDIFRHFGEVTEDKTKFYGNRGTASTGTGIPESPDKGTNRRDVASSNNVDVEAKELEEADESEATYLTSQPSTLGFGKMRQYQIEGLNWMIRLQENGVNGILADEMGLGKTLQSISILVYMMEYTNVNGPHLVVVPKSTLSNWMAELKRWAPTITAIKFHGNKQEREQIASEILQPGQRDELRTWNVAVTTYEVCNMDKQVLNKFAWSYLIIDEAHRYVIASSSFLIVHLLHSTFTY